MTDNQNFKCELDMLHSKLTVLEKGRHEEPECQAEIRACRERIARLHARGKAKVDLPTAA